MTSLAMNVVMFCLLMHEYKIHYDASNLIVVAIGVVVAILCAGDNKKINDFIFSK